MSPFPEIEIVKHLLALIPFALLGAGCGPTYPNCDRDDQCHEGEFCVNGHCADCRDDSHCPEGQQCDAGACAPIPGWCGSDRDCMDDETCVDHRCVPRPRGTELTETTRACELEAVYFAFDEDNLDAIATAALERDRACLAERGVTAVSITGMCDPRGTEEYNVALGDRRARAVRDHLQRLGIPRASMTSRSVGEEWARGSDEPSWARDRRAEVSAP